MLASLPSFLPSPCSRAILLRGLSVHPVSHSPVVLLVAHASSSVVEVGTLHYVRDGSAGGDGVDRLSRVVEVSTAVVAAGAEARASRAPVETRRVSAEQSGDDERHRHGIGAAALPEVEGGVVVQHFHGEDVGDYRLGSERETHEEGDPQDGRELDLAREASRVSHVGCHWESCEITEQSEEDDVEGRDVEVEAHVEEPQDKHDLHGGGEAVEDVGPQPLEDTPRLEDGCG